MIRYIAILVLLCVTFSVYGQFVQDPRKLRLNNQTTSQGLINYGSGKPNYTPTGVYDAWSYIDSTNNSLYLYRGKQWVRGNVLIQNTTPTAEQTVATNEINDALTAWYRPSDSTLYTYNYFKGKWLPSLGVYYSNTAPVNSGDVSYTETLWRKGDSTFIYFQSAWVPIVPQKLAYDQVSRSLSITFGNSVTMPLYQGASSVASGLAGLVPPAAAGQDTMLLRGDGTWVPSTSLTVGGDNWGTQVVETDNTLQNDGTLGSLLGLNKAGAANGNIWKFDGADWVLSTDLVYDGDSSITNEIQAISLNTNVLSLSKSGGSVDLSYLLDNTDAQSLAYNALTRAVTITGGTGFTFPNFTGATGIDNGVAGLVPAPIAGQQQLFLRGDGSWAAPNIVISVFTDATIDGDGTSGNPLSINQENLQDSIATMIGDQDRITVTYDDVNNEIDFQVDTNLSNYNNDAGFITQIEVDSAINANPYNDSIDADRPVLRVPSVGTNLSAYTTKQWILWHYFSAPTLSMAQSPSTTVIEVGTTQAYTYTLTVSNPGAATLSNGLFYKRTGSTTIATVGFGSSTSIVQGFTYTPLQTPVDTFTAHTYNFYGTQQWSGAGESGTATSNTRTIQAVYPVLYGVTATDLSVGGDPYTTLSKLVQTEGNKTVNMNGDGYIYYLVPKTWTDFNLSLIQDHNLFNVTAAFDTYDVTVSSTGLTNNWTNVAYKMYKLRNLTSTSNYAYTFTR